MELQPLTHNRLLEVNQNEPDGNFFGPPEYAQWQRFLRNSTELWESRVKFVINWITYLVETGSLVFTLIIGPFISTKGHETIAAIVLYILFFLANGIISHYNKKYTNSSSTRAWWLDVMLNSLTILKPYHYWKEYQSEDEQRRIVKITGTGDNIRVTEQALISLKDLNAELVEHKRAKYYQSVLQAIPMCLLQNYFLFQSYETFRLCDSNDLSRLILIPTTIYNAAKSCTEYQASKSDYEAVLHFLSYFKSKGQLPIKIESQCMLTINWLLNLFAHIANISLRVYTFSYFLNASVMLSLTCLVLVFTVNLILVLMSPQHLLEIHQNAQYGISTSPSYWTDRVTDIFVNVSTRYNKFTHKVVCSCTRIPLIFVQLLHFFIPIIVCFMIAWLTGNHHKLLDSVVVKQLVNNTNVTEYLKECPELNKWYGSNEFYSKLGEFLFPIFQSVDNRFSSYHDVYNVLHLVWLLLYAQILTAWLYAFSLNGRCCKAHDDFELYENFPVIVSYGFYSSMFDQLLKLEMPEKLQASRRFMVLTLLDPHEFYSYTNVCGDFGRKQLSDESVNSQMDKLVDPKTFKKSPQEVETDLKTCRMEKHVLLTQFNELEDSLISEQDRALFLIFRSYFDRKMYAIQSHTIERIFELMGFQKSKNLL